MRDSPRAAFLFVLVYVPWCLCAKLESAAAASAATAAVATPGAQKRAQLANFLAGGVAGTISCSLTAPIEVIKTQLQSSRVIGRVSPLNVAKEIYAVDGIGGFFRGLKPTLFGIIPTRALYFWAYTSSKSALQPLVGDSPTNHLCSAVAAGVLSNTVTNPIWMIKTRFQILADNAAGQKLYKSYPEVVQSVWKAEGFSGFFKGLSASYWGCSEGAIQWLVYERLKARLDSKSSRAGALKSVNLFLAAATSKFIATTLTYPHEVVRTRLREQARNGAFRYTGMWQALSLIAREEGRKGLYAGYTVHVARTVPNTAIMFLSFELISAWLKRAVAERSVNSNTSSSL